MAAKKKTEPISKALVLQEMMLSPRQNGIVRAETPKEFIKERPTRGGKKAKYVEGGYVISQLNNAFSPIGWDFEVIEQGILDKEVWVKGRLTLKDPKSGYTFSKTQYGQHIREENKVPLGDTLKAAATDAMKKCASMLGIALDVYWGVLDTEEAVKPVKAVAPSGAEMCQRAKVMVNGIRDGAALLAYREKVETSKVFNAAQKKELIDAIDNRLQDLMADQTKK